MDPIRVTDVSCLSLFLGKLAGVPTRSFSKYQPEVQSSHSFNSATNSPPLNSLRLLYSSVPGNIHLRNHRQSCIHSSNASTRVQVSKDDERSSEG